MLTPDAAIAAFAVLAGVGIGTALVLLTYFFNLTFGRDS